MSSGLGARAGQAVALSPTPWHAGSCPDASPRGALAGGWPGRRASVSAPSGTLRHPPAQAGTSQQACSFEHRVFDLGIREIGS